ncbi:hypothetical protein ACEXQE_21270 [Herbiconiux sp. P17]|uniref:hypothetical protein n=1 Tax=Herbiconiux wuyangfengii TaxID=3342794 RepID=UPI0035B6E374
MVFGRSASEDDIPAEAARSVVPKAADDDFRLLGTVDDAKYYAVVLKGEADPWCLLRVDGSGEAAAPCSSEPRLVSYYSANIVALSNDRPDEIQDWREIGTSFWVAASP